MHQGSTRRLLNRRRFLHTTAAAGVGLVHGTHLMGHTATTEGDDDINVALIGAGDQGSRLMYAGIRTRGIRFKAVCDLWEDRHLKRAAGILKRYGHTIRAYVDYLEMLDREEDLDAAIIATPDCWHARHTIACLKAGLHVYCETEMSNTLDGARRMVQTARETGKLLQIGHQRRCNPRYVFAHDKLLVEAKLIGQIAAVNSQWHRASYAPLLCPSRHQIDEGRLNAYGYRSMHEFLNWRRFIGLGSGPVVHFGSNQIDTHNWYLRATPKSVLASGRHRNPREADRQWHDMAMVIYEYDTPQGPVNASYQVLNSNSSFGHFESFLGNRGTLVMSEASFLGEAYREPHVSAQSWARWIEKGYLKPLEELKPMERSTALPMYSVDETPPPASTLLPYKLPVRLTKPYHQTHLENFFEAIGGKTKLACPAEVGYKTAVAVLGINEAIKTERKLLLKPEDFVA